MIRVQAQAFDTAAELAKLKRGRTDIGGSVVFVGTMRDLSEGAAISASRSRCGGVAPLVIFPGHNLQPTPAVDR